MITTNKSKEIAEYIIRQKEQETGVDLAIVSTKKTKYGNVYFYNSKEYLKTKDFSEFLLGNSPFIVDVENGDVHFFGTAYAVDRYLEDYAKYRSDYEKMRTF